MSVQLVFQCDDLRDKILSFIPKRCKSCHQKLLFKHNWNKYDYMGVTEITNGDRVNVNY